MSPECHHRRLGHHPSSKYSMARQTICPHAQDRRFRLGFSVCGKTPFMRTDHSISVHGSSRMEVPRHSNRVGCRSSEDPAHHQCSGRELDSSPVSLFSTVHVSHQRTARRQFRRPFQDPSVKAAAAKERLSKLETALSAMDGMEGPEVVMLRNAYKRAWRQCEAPRSTSR